MQIHDELRPSWVAIRPLTLRTQRLRRHQRRVEPGLSALRAPTGRRDNGRAPTVTLTSFRDNVHVRTITLTIAGNIFRFHAFRRT